MQPLGERVADKTAVSKGAEGDRPHSSLPQKFYNYERKTVILTRKWKDPVTFNTLKKRGYIHGHEQDA